jgi:hypothetical protein
MKNKNEDDESRALRTPVISPAEMVVLAIVIVLGLILAGPDLARTWGGAMLSGKCDAEPPPKECIPPFW